MACGNAVAGLHCPAAITDGKRAVLKDQSPGSAGTLAKRREQTGTDQTSACTRDSSDRSSPPFSTFATTILGPSTSVTTIL